MTSKKKGKKTDEVTHLFEHNGISLGKLTLEETRKLITAKEELFYSLFELTNDAVFIISMKGEYLLVNQRAADLLGYTIKEMIGKSAISFTAPGDREDALNRLSSLQKGQVVPIYERNLYHKDGTIIPVELNVAIVTNKKGEPLYMQSAARDIRSRKKMEEQLRENEEKYRILFNEAREGILLIDRTTGAIVEANPEFIRQSGRTIDELKLLKIWEIRPEEMKIPAKEKFFEIKKKGKGGSNELDILKPDGTRTSIEFLSRSVKIHGKQYLISISRNITKRKKSDLRLKEQQELLQKQRDELDSFASNVAHDIRGKLQVISLYNELMVDNIYSEKIAEQISEMVQFLDNSLLLAKKGEIVGEFSKFALDELLADLLAKVRSLKPNMTITIENLPVVKGDRERLNQVFENLLMNIVKHSKATEVKIHSKEKNGYHCIHVVDNGVGMSKKIQEKIIRAWNTKIYTTFGLMIVKKIIDAHNGSITFKSKLNQGSTFIIKLPKD